jgi:hypothetical protein
MNISKSLRSIVVVGMAGIAVSATACSGTADPGPSTTEGRASARFDGETLFRGIFFGKGPVAERLPEYWGAEAVAQRAKITNSPEVAAQKLEAAIAQMKSEGWAPAIISQAEQTLSDIRSGQPIPEAELSDTALVQELVMARIAESDPTFFSRFAGDMQSGSHVRVGLAIDEASARFRDGMNRVFASDSHAKIPVVGPVVVAVALAVVAVAVLVVFVEDQPSSSHSRLQHDVAVDTLTVRLQ